MKAKPPKSENEMGKATLHMLIGFYIGDMQRRNCRPDSITTNRRVLERFARSLTPSGEQLSRAAGGRKRYLMPCVIG